MWTKSKSQLEKKIAVQDEEMDLCSEWLNLKENSHQ